MIELVLDLVVKEILKDFAPFMVCIVTFLGCCIGFKFLFKTNRYNPLVYIFSMVVVFLSYFAFIEMTGLSRYDYFLDGIKAIREIFSNVFREAYRYLLSLLNHAHIMKADIKEMLFTLTSLDVDALYITYKTTKKVVLFNIYYIVNITIEKTEQVYHSVKETKYTSINHNVECVFNC